MGWIGKLLGGVFGYLMGQWIGLVIGLLIGHWFDRGLARGRVGVGRAREVHRIFFRASFAVMGHVAKADGRVSEAEIAAAETVMARMRLTQKQRQEAIGFFQEGKSPDFDLDATLDEFLRACRGHVNLVRIFIEVQLQAALADGRVEGAERRVLMHIAQRLGLSERDYERLEQLLTGGWRRAHAGAHSSVDLIEEAYRELGVERSASDAEVKRAYRKLMSEHHPDKLVSRGMPEEMVSVAKERTQEIQQAYEAVKRSRGMR